MQNSGGSADDSGQGRDARDAEPTSNVNGQDHPGDSATDREVDGEGFPSNLSRSSSGQGFLTCLTMLFIFFGSASTVAYRQLHVPRSSPKSAAEAGPAGFSEERAFHHVQKLAGEIGFRQEGSPGLVQAGEYFLDVLAALQAQAHPSIRVEVEVSHSYEGSFNIVFLQHSMALAYQNLTNILVRVSAADSDPSSPSVLVNGHYDSTISTPGAADCASCVATMLETLRQVVEGGIVPPVPLIFLFNGGEEIFLKAVHGFLTQHSWSASVGAFVNLEASGTRLPDMVVQSSGPHWVQDVYSKTAVHPMGTVISKDVFPHIPGDTDFRIMAEDFDDIPGLDIMLTLNGYAYHTPLDNPANLQPGALQVRGENLLPLLLGLGRSPELRNRQQRRMARWSDEPLPANASTSEAPTPSGRGTPSGPPVFFDVFHTFMVHYSHSTAVSLLTLLLGLLVLSPQLATHRSSGLHSTVSRVDQLIVGCVSYAASWLLAVLLPVLLAVVRVWASKAPMTWYAQPVSAALSFAPMALAGCLLPHAFRQALVLSDPSDLAQERVDWSSHWGGVVGCNALFSLAITVLGGGGGYLFFWWAVLLLPSLALFRRLQRVLGAASPWCLFAYLLPAAAPVTYSLGFWLLFTQFVAEKMGASGTHPLPFGMFLPDVVMAASVGATTALCFAPLAPVLSRWLGRARVLRALLYASLLSSAYMCSLFPYSASAPKRLLLNRTYNTQGPHDVLSASTIVASADANDASFMFRHVPAFRDAFLHSSPDYRTNRAAAGGDPWPGVHPAISVAKHGSLLAWYPVSELLDRPAVASARRRQRDAAADSGLRFPELRVVGEEWVPPPAAPPHPEGGAGDGDDTWRTHPSLQQRRVHVELDSGSLSRVWCAVLNITGPLVAWSLGSGSLPDPEFPSAGGAPYRILHLGGGNGRIHWRFWFQSSGTRKLSVRLAVLDTSTDQDVDRMAQLLPPWVALYETTSYTSSYHL